MMRSLFPGTLCCLSLLFLQQQLLALPTGTRLDRHRLNLKKVPEGEEGESFIPRTFQNPSASLSLVQEASRDWWKHLLLRAPPLRWATEAPVENNSLPSVGAGLHQRAPRGRRHIHARGRGHHHHQPQLMRVGCVLGTCQVQNLSHRLYQLIGQSGREDTSPMNPKSPHSYG